MGASPAVRPRGWPFNGVGGQTGAVLPYLFLLPYFREAGLGLADFLGAAYANGAAGGITTDLFFSSGVFWILIAIERRGGKGPNPALFVVLNLLIGLSCALPAWLYAREARADSAN